MSWSSGEQERELEQLNLWIIYMYLGQLIDEDNRGIVLQPHACGKIKGILKSASQHQSFHW